MTGSAAATIDHDDVVDRVAGLSADTAEEALSELGAATVELWPGWVSTVPEAGWRIEPRRERRGIRPGAQPVLMSIVSPSTMARSASVSPPETLKPAWRLLARRSSDAVSSTTWPGSLSCATDEGAELVVVGLPLNLDGSEGPQAAVVRAFGEALRGAGLAILYEDERLTSWEAERQLASGGRTPDRRTGEVDSAAAQLILQQYLDAQPAQPAEASRSAEETE